MFNVNGKFKAFKTNLVETIRALPTKEYWVLKPAPGSLSDDTRWSNHDLDPVHVSRRTWRDWDFATYWMCDQFATSNWATATGLLMTGLTARETIPIGFLAYFCVGIFMTINGRAGAKYHISFPVYARLSFGMWGAYFAILLRVILALFWMAILTYQAGDITVEVVSAIWPSFGHFPNKLPASADISSGNLLCVFLFWMLQLPLSLIPVHKLRHFFFFKAILAFPTMLPMLIWACVRAKGHGPLLDHSAQLGQNRGLKIAQAVNTPMAQFATLACNAADFTRFSKTGRISLVQLIAIPVTASLPFIVGVLVNNACQVVYNVNISEVADAIGLWDNRAAVFFCGMAWIIANIGSNISANTISFATDLTSVFPRMINIRRGVVLASCLTVAICPWKIYNSATAFVNFLSASGAYMGPILGVIATDFYIIRKGVVDVRELYKPDGAYSYYHGVNWRAFAAFLCSFIPNMPGFVHAINPEIPSKNPYTYSMCWAFGVVVSGFAYYVICRVFPPTDSLAVSEFQFDDLVTEVTGLEGTNIPLKAVSEQVKDSKTN